MRRVLLLAALVVGCAGTTYVPDDGRVAGTNEFERAKANCRSRAMGSSAGNNNAAAGFIVGRWVFKSCMRGQGWVPDDERSYASPQEYEQPVDFATRVRAAGTIDQMTRVIGAHPERCVFNRPGFQSCIWSIRDEAGHVLLTCEFPGDGRSREINSCEGVAQ